MDFRWKPYIPVAKRRQKAERVAAQLKNSGKSLSPVMAARGSIAKTFWGRAWCQNLERYSDYSNRLPRGRSYLRNGSLLDLKIAPGEADAQVMGSSLYRIKVKISELPPSQWQAIVRDCARSIDSLVELLQGKLSTSVMERITRPATGLLPSPKEIAFRCSCPDAAAMCKHVAATLYGIGARFDAAPELLFSLRKVDAKELIARAAGSGPLVQKSLGSSRILDHSSLADVFGIDMVGLATKPAAAGKRVPSPKRAMAAAPKRRGHRRSGD